MPFVLCHDLADSALKNMNIVIQLRKFQLRKLKVLVHTFNSSTQKKAAEDLCELKASHSELQDGQDYRQKLCLNQSVKERKERRKEGRQFFRVLAHINAHSPCYSCRGPQPCSQNPDQVAHNCLWLQLQEI